MLNTQKHKSTLQQSGFTLVEVMMVVVIMAIVLSLAAPAFVEMRRNTALSETTNKLLGAMRYARAEAVRTGETHVVGATTDPEKPNNVTFLNAFGSGVKKAPDYYIAVWKNTDMQSKYAFSSSDKDELVRVDNLVREGTHLTSSVGNLVTIAFFPNGTAVDNANTYATSNTIQIGICDDRTKETGRMLTLLASGVVAMTENTGCK